MEIHRSSINFQNLIRDLSEMYTCEAGEVVVIELVANALDAKADFISIDYNPSQRVLVVEDNGKGMDSSVFAEYHDFAAGLKTRGGGIGFAGLGAKISFNIAERVITETKNKTFSGGSNWYLKSKHDLIWEDMQPKHLKGYGTRVEVHFNATVKLPYGTRAELVSLLHRHYLPLFDSDFLELYKILGKYPIKLRFEVNKQVVKPTKIQDDLKLEKIKKFFPEKSGKRFGYGIFGLSKSEYPLGQEICGVLLCTHGKVVKQDFFNQFPGAIGARIFGIVEVPDFVKYLTTSKTDFMHKGRHKEFEGLYDPLRKEFKVWLKEIGVETSEIIDTNEAIKLERELKKIIDEIPELSDFFGFRAKKMVLGKSQAGSMVASEQEGVDATLPFGDGSGSGGIAPMDSGEYPGKSLIKDKQKGNERANPIGRTAKRGPKIAFIEAFTKIDMAWVDGNNIVINIGHPAYVKAQPLSATRKLHCLFSIAGAIQRFIQSNGETPDPMFTDRMMSAWAKK